MLSICSGFEGRRVLVVGDVMLDEHIQGQVRRLSPEAPVPIVEIQSRRFHPGGAANVASNISSLGGSALLAGIIDSISVPASLAITSLLRNISFKLFQIQDIAVSEFGVKAVTMPACS